MKMLQDELDMHFNYEPIPYSKVKTGKERIAKGKMHDAIKQIKPDETVEDVMWRVYKIKSGFTHKILWDDKVPSTMIAGHDDVWLPNGNKPADADIVRIQTFPEDYDFCDFNVLYVCGMSVPPIMIKRIVTRLIEQGIYD